MSELDLKPCPFCGAVSGPVLMSIGLAAPPYYVRCSGCGVTTVTTGTIKHAKEMWNMRTLEIGVARGKENGGS